MGEGGGFQGGTTGEGVHKALIVTGIITMAFSSKPGQVPLYTAVSCMMKGAEWVLC